jgi:hypothetical protein
MTLALPQYSPSLLSKLFPSPFSGDEKPATPDGASCPPRNAGSYRSIRFGL